MLNNNELFRILKMREAGLTDVWLTWYKADASRCIGIVHNKRPTFKPLTLMDISSAGIVLLVGYCVSFFVLVCENIFCFLCSKNKKKNISAAIVIDQREKGNKGNECRPNLLNPQMCRYTNLLRLIGCSPLRTLFACCKVIYYLITKTIVYSIASYRKLILK